MNYSQLKNRRRRLFLGCTSALLLSVVNPKFNKQSSLELIKHAGAWQLQALGFAVNLLSTFTNSGNGGLSSYLTNIKQLSEENIRLSQSIIVRLSEVQVEIARLPNRLKPLFVENEEYRIREVTGSIVLNMDNVRIIENGDLTELEDESKIKLREIITWGSKLAGAQFVPYGVGPMGAICAPVIAAHVAKAQTALNDFDAASAEIQSKYLPWLMRILDEESKGSLINLIYEEGRRNETLVQTILERTPINIKEYIAPFIKEILETEIDKKARWRIPYCVSYGEFEKSVADYTFGGNPIHEGRLVPPYPSEHGKRSYPPWFAEMKHYFKPTLKNHSTLYVKYEVDSMNGPTMTYRHTWITHSDRWQKRLYEEGRVCEMAAGGHFDDASTSDREKSWYLSSSSRASAFDRDIKLFFDEAIEPIIVSRRLLWTYSNLYRSVQSAENRIRNAFQL